MKSYRHAAKKAIGGAGSDLADTEMLQYLTYTYHYGVYVGSL